MCLLFVALDLFIGNVVWVITKQITSVKSVIDKLFLQLWSRLLSFEIHFFFFAVFLNFVFFENIKKKVGELF